MEHSVRETGHTPHSVAYLAPVVPLHGEIPPDVERMLAATARTAAGGNQIARDSLYWAVAGRLGPSIWRTYRLHTESRRRPPLDLADLQQTGYLVFVEMVTEWDGDDSFVKYLFGLFMWRLRRMLRNEHREPLVSLPADVPIATAGPSLAELVEHLLVRLPARQRRIVDLRISHSLPFTEIAGLLAVSPRTIQRDLQEIAQTVEAMTID